MSKSKKRKWYVVFKGKAPGIYTTWEQCQAQVHGFSGCQFKSFDSEHDAKRAYGKSQASSSVGYVDIEQTDKKLKNIIFQPPTGKNAVRSPRQAKLKSPVEGFTGSVTDPMQIATAFSEKTIVEIYTDGACFPNPGPGGWAALLMYKNKSREVFGYDTNTTNNRMEMFAAIKGLESMTKLDLPVRIYTDSQYLLRGITDWIDGWKRMRWVNSQGEPVKNIDLWRRLDRLASRFMYVHWVWVRGHSGVAHNETVDKLAGDAQRGKLFADSSCNEFVGR